jgi:hypothetical protein
MAQNCAARHDICYERQFRALPVTRIVAMVTLDMHFSACQEDIAGHAVRGSTTWGRLRRGGYRYNDTTCVWTQGRCAGALTMRTLAPLGGPGRQLLQHERRPSQRALQEWWFRLGGTATKLHMLAINRCQQHNIRR